MKPKSIQDRDRRNAVRSSTDLRHLAKNALRPIERKLRGVYSPSNIKSRNHGGSGGSSSGEEREISTNNLVEMLIQEAIDGANLVCDSGPFFSPLVCVVAYGSVAGQDVSWMGCVALKGDVGRCLVIFCHDVRISTTTLRLNNQVDWFTQGQRASCIRRHDDKTMSVSMN